MVSVLGFRLEPSAACGEQAQPTSRKMKALARPALEPTGLGFRVYKILGCGVSGLVLKVFGLGTGV